MSYTHTDACRCETCQRFRARIAALEVELKQLRQALAEALVDTSPPTEAEIAYARQLEEAGR